MSPLLTKGDIRPPEVWVRADSHDRQASPIDVPEPLPTCWTASWGPGEALEPSPETARRIVATLKATPHS